MFKRFFRKARKFFGRKVIPYVFRAAREELRRRLRD